MPVKEQTMVDERAVRWEKQDQAKEQAAVRGGQKKEQRDAPKKSDSLIGQWPGSSMAQAKLANKVDLINPELVPTLEKDEEEIWIGDMEEEGATNSPMTLTPRGRLCLGLNEKDGKDPLAQNIWLSETSQSSNDLDLIQRKIKYSDTENTQYNVGYVLYTLHVLHQ